MIIFRQNDWAVQLLITKIAMQLLKTQEATP